MQKKVVITPTVEDGRQQIRVNGECNFSEGSPDQCGVGSLCGGWDPQRYAYDPGYQARSFAHTVIDSPLTRLRHDACLQPLREFGHERRVAPLQAQGSTVTRRRPTRSESRRATSHWATS